MKFKLFFVLLSLLLASCASVKRTESATVEVYPDVKAAAVQTKPIVNLKYGDFVNINIQNISPSVKGLTSANKFEIVGIEGRAGEHFSIMVGSICDCLGFRKWAVYPITHLLKENGDLVASEKIENPKLRSLTGVFPETGRYKIVVVADSANEGKKLSDIAAYIGGVGLFTIPEKAHPTGLVQVNWPKQ